MECSLYLHIPFCTEKCDYCDFYSLPLKALGGAEGDRFTGRYVDALLRETERRFGELRRAAGPLPDGPPPDGPPPDGPEFSGRPALSVPTVYIGGGTPSVLGAVGMDRLLDGAAGIISAASGPPPGGPPPDASGPPPDGPPPDAGGPSEITVEANPETADPAFLRVCADRGVRRLSLGVQTFDPSLRGALGRRGCGGGEGTELLSRRLAAASEIFGEGLSLDLMSGLPGQDEGALLADIAKALSHRPGHLSLYALSPEEGTPLAARNTVPGPDEADRLWLAGRDALIRAGYEHYEVSNFARPGRRCL
ncbi:MAG: hypothetical protein LBD09_05345, partial [Treponema sp.]|nr:hypothetical protein [Treponema sp.]